jgi:putative DNA methylase
MSDFPRLIEYAFPLKQASLDSVHEKNVRHGHISTLHIWPARRPLAACRAALIATLLPDPSADPKPEGMRDEEWQKEIVHRRKELCEKIGGKVVKKIERKRMPNGQIVEREKEVTEGGILHWGRETENRETLDWFRDQIRKTYGEQAPKVLDPFAGGGAIPLEAMRLGCEATAMDINPVAWFVLKCTLEYPQKLAGKTLPLPEFILRDESFMRDFFQRAKGHTKGEITKGLERLGRELKRGDQGALDFGDKLDIQADLAWHVRAWGQWVLDTVRRELGKYYPVYADFESLDRVNPRAYEKQPMRLVALKVDGTADINALNKEFSEEYLADKRNPRWVAKPVVAYLCARTAACKNCRAMIPLLKTRWLCKKEGKRVLLAMEINRDKTGINFRVENDVPIKGGNSAQRRESDKRMGEATMFHSGARCPCCGAIATMDDLQYAAKAGLWGESIVAVVVDGQSGKEYRPRAVEEVDCLRNVLHIVNEMESSDPLDEPISDVRPSPNARGLSGLTRYGIDRFSKVFNNRQRLSLLAIVNATKALIPPQTLLAHYPLEWGDAIASSISLGVDRLADRNSTLCHWDKGRETIAGTFQRYALRVNWDYCEVNPFARTTGNYIDAIEWISLYLEHALSMAKSSPLPHISLSSACNIHTLVSGVDLILTDPPYYDAIPYGDLSDFFYVWLRRMWGWRCPCEFGTRLTTKEEELVQHASRGGGNHEKARKWYESGMADAFRAAFVALKDEGRFVVVFAHKHPEAWEALASAIFRAGFLVHASWPIQTEMPNKAAGGARLASSIWLVCKKRPALAKFGWDSHVLEEMRRNIHGKLREFWDAGIRGPDFVWAATGPALEAYSRHPVVKKANDPNQTMTVSEFLGQVRRMVVDFVVGRVLSRGSELAHENTSDRLDEPTAYYLLHRHDLGFDEAPAGACILYAISCGLSDRELADTWDLIAYTKGQPDEEERDEEGVETEDEVDDSAEEGSGSKVKLKTWTQRRGRSMGYEAPSGKTVPLIDRVHRLMHLWKGGDVHKVDEYLDENGLRRHELFKRLIQSLIELAGAGSEERSLLESISNHIGAKGAVADEKQVPLTLSAGDE